MASYNFLKNNAEEIATLDINDLSPTTKKYLSEISKNMGKRYAKDSNHHHVITGMRLLDISVKLKKNEQLNDIEKSLACKHWTNTTSQFLLI
ncbi:hypothetical protein [Paenibacillus sp. LK1]|uniref:hypothetical protein n=1 Tax=Paenibacillus sp. LK1 TaxID=2053014 RepID=UPI000C17AA22|nr:hypothetical protein [Paenibacillus sp. LK1]PIH61091.1 hypothetical protein CS562_01320 [Paenibacillus sp. LK1]